jgi:hypothetical protein
VWDDIDPASAEPPGSPAVDRVDGIVDHAWGEASPMPGIDPDTFAVEWVGEIVAEQTKVYDFSVIANDGVRLFLDDRLVVAGGWRDQPEAEYFAEPLALEAGQRVKIRLQAFDRTGPATVQLRWNGGNNDAREAIPSVFLFPTVAANDEVAAVPLRPVTFPEVFSLPEAEGTPASVVVRWQDNAFGETAYEIERATDATFTERVARFTSTRGRDQFIDTGGPDADGNPAPLEPGMVYYYRVRPAGAPAFVNGGNNVDAFAHWRWGEELRIAGFATPEKVTLNGYASTTAEGSIKITHDSGGQTGSAFLNRAFDVNHLFYNAAFDFRIGASGGGGGMAFVIHNADPAQPGRAQVNALGTGGAGLGYGGIRSSVAVVIDVSDGLDAIGVWTQGQVRPAGTWDELPANVRRDNSPPGTVHASNGLINLTHVNLDGGKVFRMRLEYDQAGLLTLRLTDPLAGDAPLLLARFAVNLADEIGGDNAAMGWTAVSGTLGGKTEVYNFDYRGLHGDPIPLSGVFVRGTEWSDAFKDYLDLAGEGHAAYGYQVAGLFRDPPATNPHGVLPWINMNEIVLRYVSPPTGSAIPTPQSVSVVGEHGAYTVTHVTQAPSDPASFVLHLSTPLGGGNPATGVVPVAAENGDRVSISFEDVVSPAVRVNVLQGDTDHLNEGGDHVVLARDYAEVKRRFFRSTTSPAGGTDNDYSLWHDVDGSGIILARDFAEVKKRFFHTLNIDPVAAAPVAAAPPTPPASRRPRPETRSAFADLLS